MNKALLVLFFQMLCIPCFAQAQFKQLKAAADKWLNATLIAEPPSKGVVSRTIDYPQGNYCINAFFSKGLLAEGQIIEVLNTENEPKSKLKGKVSYIENQPIISGVKYDFTEKGVCYTYGTFFISNTSDNHLSFKPKNAYDFKITDAEILYYVGYYLECPTIVSVKDHLIVVDGKTGSRGYTEFSAPLEASKLSSIGYNHPFALLMSTGKNATMNWEKGLYKEFKGTVVPEKTDDGSILFHFLTGEKNGFQSGHKTVKVYEEGESLCMELNDDPANNLLKQETIVVPNKTLISQDSYWDMRSFLENMKEVRWEFRNGDCFIGQATFIETLSDDGKSSSISESISTGTYKYTNGDYFTGNVGGITWGHLFLDGTTFFKDNSAKKGNWIQQYDLTDAQWKELANALSPSSFRKKAEEFTHINSIRKSIYNSPPMTPAEHIVLYYDSRDAFQKYVNKQFLTDPLPTASTKEVIDIYKEYLVKVRYFLFLREIVEDYVKKDHGPFSSRNISDALMWDSHIHVPKADAISNKFFDALLPNSNIVSSMSPQTVKTCLINRYDNEVIGIGSPKRNALEYMKDLDEIIDFLTPYINVYSELASIEYNKDQKDLICSGYYRYWHQQEMILRDAIADDVSDFLTVRGKIITHFTIDNNILFFSNGDIAYTAICIDNAQPGMYYFPRGLKNNKNHFFPFHNVSYEHYLYDNEWYKADEVLNGESSSSTNIKYYRDGKKSYVKQISGYSFNEKWYDTDGLLIRSNP